MSNPAGSTENRDLPQPSTDLDSAALSALNRELQGYMSGMLQLLHDHLTALEPITPFFPKQIQLESPEPFGGTAED